MAGAGVEPKPQQRRNLKQLYRDLVTLGYAGSYDRVAAFTRTWRWQQQEATRVAGRGTFVPLTFAPGEAFQFDWSEDWAVIGGERTKLMVAQFKLCYSRAFMLRAYPLQTHEMLLDAHNQALAALGGVPTRGIYDNMKTAVDRVLRGQGPRGQCARPGDGQPFPGRTASGEAFSQCTVLMVRPSQGFEFKSREEFEQLLKHYCQDATRL